jgi:hypothetical protein
MENPAPKDTRLASVQGPTGVVTDRGTCGEKRKKMNRFSIVGTLNSGDPECAPKAAARRLPDEHVQPTGDVIRTFWESDPPIVIRDGSAGHKAKEWAGSNASTALTPGHVDPDQGVKLPACIGGWFWHLVSASFSCARFLRSPVR